MAAIAAVHTKFIDFAPKQVSDMIMNHVIPILKKKTFADNKKSKKLITKNYLNTYSKEQIQLLNKLKG